MRTTTDALALPAALTVALAAHLALLVPFLNAPAQISAPTTRDLAVTVAAPSQDAPPTKVGFQAIANQQGAGSGEVLRRLRATQTGRERDAQQSTERQGQTDGVDRASAEGVIATLGRQNRLLGPGEIQLNRAANTQITGMARTPAVAELDLTQTQALGFGPAQGQAVATLKNAQAGYLQRWRQHIQATGAGLAHQWPDLTGEVKIRATVDYQGRLPGYQILRSSGWPALDQAAIGVLESAAPFEPFPNALVAFHERLNITRIWQFNQGRHTLR